jgi:peptide/nickel transport system substrate-binding protein
MAFVLCAALVFPACGDSGGSGGTNAASGGSSSSGTPKGKELVIAVYRDGAMDELDTASYNGPHFLFKMIYEGLVEDGGEGKILPLLATSWDISEDGKTYTYHLREGVKFSDGTDFDADAVIFNLKRWVGNDTFSALASYQVDDMEALDKYTVKVVYKQNAYSVLIEQSYPRPVRFLSPASIEADPNNPAGRFTRPIGTGQWMLETYEKDREYTLVPNPHYWGEKPILDRLRFKVVLDSQARILALKSGEVDIVGGDYVAKIPIEVVPELMADKSIEVLINETLCSHVIAFNNDEGKFADKNLRLAMNYAIDTKVITESLFDNIGSVADGFFQKEVPYVTDKNNYGYPGDKEKAKSLLEEAGYVDSNGDGIREKDGKNLEYNFVLSVAEFPEWKSLAEFVQSELTQVGVKVNLNILDRNGYYETVLNTRMFDLALFRTPSDSWMPHTALGELFAPFGGLDRPAKIWTDPYIMERIPEVLATIDETERQARYDDIFGYISGDAVSIPIYYPVAAYAYNPKRVKNFELGIDGYAPIKWDKLDVGE